MNCGRRAFSSIHGCSGCAQKGLLVSFSVSTGEECTTYDLFAADVAKTPPRPSQTYPPVNSVLHSPVRAALEMAVGSVWRPRPTLLQRSSSSLQPPHTLRLKIRGRGCPPARARSLWLQSQLLRHPERRGAWRNLELLFSLEAAQWPLLKRKPWLSLSSSGTGSRDALSSRRW